MTRLIAEIGQNHQGSLTMAKALIDMAVDPKPADLKFADHYSCHGVKFVKRDLKNELTRAEMDRPYGGRHSFGPTYGEHRAALEFTDEQLYELYDYAKAQQLKYIITLCHPNCLSILKLFTPDSLKVASRDLTNLPLLEELARTKIPIILSTGMADERDLAEAVELVMRHHSQITILHCLSTYPAPFSELNLRTILWLKDHYAFPIGFSDHTVGIMAAVAAAAIGAEVIEKHITLDRTLRGTDQEGSLERDGLWRLLRDLWHLDLARGVRRIERSPTCESARKKLERTIATSADLPAGTVITESDITLLSPGTGYLWRDRHKVIGKTVARDLHEAEIILPDDIA